MTIYQNKVLGMAPGLFAYWPNDEVSGLSARDLGPNSFAGVHNADVVLAQPGPDASSLAASYTYNEAQSRPAYTDLLINNPTLATTFPKTRGSLMVWAKLNATVAFPARTATTNGTVTTLIDSGLIGSLNGLTPSHYVLTLNSGAGATLFRAVLAFDNTTGTVTVAQTLNNPQFTLAGTRFALWDSRSCEWCDGAAPNPAGGGKPICFYTSDAVSGGVLFQAEKQIDMCTANRIAQSLEQQTWTPSLFSQQADPGWNHLVITWDESADQVYMWRNGVPMNTDNHGVSLPWPQTGLGNWTANPTRCFIGCGRIDNPTAQNFYTAKTWRGPIGDIALWSTVLTAGNVAALYDRTVVSRAFALASRPSGFVPGARVSAFAPAARPSTFVVPNRS